MRSVPRFRPGREGPTVEWKVALSRSDRVAATLCAFANGAGGTLLVGVSDAGEVVGVDDPPAVAAALSRIASERLDPPVPLRVRAIEAGGRVVVEAVVEAARELPVAVRSRGGRSTVYLREGNASRPAEAAERKALARGTRPKGALDEDARRVLRLLRARSLPAGEIARAARLGARAAKRATVRLLEAGLLMETETGRLWVTPAGHRDGGDA